MNAIVYRQYGSPDVMRLEQVERPEPGPGEVLVEVRAASVNAADWHMLRGDPAPLRLSAGLRRPRRTILGADVAGVVVAAGEGARLRPGDEVFGDLSGAGWGGFAELVCAPESALAPKPARLSFEEAAAVPLAGATALQAMRAGRVRAGDRVLVSGASGGVGTFALQIARALGGEVTAVCSARNLELARSLGAARAIDYAREDFAAGGPQYDLIVAANGDRPIGDYRRALRPGGRYVMVGGSNRQIAEAMLLGPLLSLAGGVTMRGLLARCRREDLLALGELIDAGHVTPVVDRRYPLAEVPQAVRYMEEGHARGKVVIRVAGA